MHRDHLACFVVVISTAAVASAQAPTSTAYTAGGLQITITYLGLLPGGSASSGLAINDQPTIVGLGTDSALNLQRPFWNAGIGAIVGMAENMNPASTAIPESMNESREMAGSEVYGDNKYQGVFWNAVGLAFALPAMAGADPFYGGLHTKAHGVNNLGQIVGSAKEAAPDYYTHAVRWPDEVTEAVDLGFLGQDVPLNWSVAYGVNDLGHVVGSSASGSLTRGFLWRDGQMIDLGALNGQVVSEAYAVNNTGLIAGKSNFYPVTWQYDSADPGGTPTIEQLPIPAGFFDGPPRAVNDSGAVAGYAGAPNVYSHAILWRDGVAIDLGVWPGGHYSVANGINELGQIVGTGTVAGDFLDHALMWTVDGGGAPAWSDLGHGLAGAGGVPVLVGSGSLAGGSQCTLALNLARPSAPLWLVAGLTQIDAPFKGGVLVPDPLIVVGTSTNVSGAFSLLFGIPVGVPAGTDLVMQGWIADPIAVKGLAASNAVKGTTP